MKDITAMTDLLLEDILQSGANGIAILEVTGNKVQMIYANERFYKQLGYQKEELGGDYTSLLRNLHLDGKSKIYEKVVTESLKGHGYVEEELFISSKMKKGMWFLSKVSLLEKNGTIMRFCATVTDITEKKTLQQCLRIEKERFTLLEHLEDEIPFEYNPQMDVLTITQKTAQKIGCETEIPSFLQNNVYGAYIYAADLRKLKESIYNILCTPQKGEMDVRLLADGKNYRWYRIYYSSLANEEGEVIRVLGRGLNIQKIKSDMEKMEKKLRVDPLTGLLNQQTFEKEVMKKLEDWDRSFAYAIAFTDINNFEYVNSNFGYEAGNKMLCDYARVLEQVPGVVACCRLYSDYFMILCKAGEPEELKEHVGFSTEYFVNQQKELYPASNLRLSTGLYFIETEPAALDFPTIMENANLARKYAKERREDLIYIYDEELRQSREHEQLVAGSLHDAIKHEKIVVFLQPKFSLVERTVIGAEALARWEHEDGDLRSPIDFIPVLEKYGYVVDLDFYVYEQVLKTIKKWTEDGKDMFPVSINFSRCHIRYEDFVERVCQLAEDYGIDKNYVEIEITENSINEDSDKMFRDMKALREAGFKVNIDDFGTGFSSLNMLLQAPVDTVKVDKSFMQHIGDSEKEKNYVNHLAHLIAAAEKEIIFEGVETERQAKILMDCGYTMAQGYLFGKPMPIEEYEQNYL